MNNNSNWFLVSVIKIHTKYAIDCSSCKLNWLDKAGEELKRYIPQISIECTTYLRMVVSQGIRVMMRRDSYFEKPRNRVIMFEWELSPSWTRASLKLAIRTSYLSSSRMLLALMSLQDH